MKFFAVYEGGELKEVGKLYGDFVTDFAITEAEYNTLLVEIHAKAQLVDDVYNGVKSLDDVPAEWRDEIQRRVTERQEADAEAEPEQSEMDDMAAGGDSHGAPAAQERWHGGHLRRSSYP